MQFPRSICSSSKPVVAYEVVVAIIYYSGRQFLAFSFLLLEINHCNDRSLLTDKL